MSAIFHQIGEWVWSAVPGLLAQSAGEADPTDVQFTVADLPWLLGIALVFLILVGILVFKFMRGVSEQFGDDAAAEAAFERELLREAKSRKDASVPAQPPEETGSEPSGAPAPELYAPGGQVACGNLAAGSIEELVRNLTKLTVLGDREGQLTLAIPPHAPIHRLRRGGHAVILPRLESEAIMAYCVQRFDVAFALTGSGEVLVLSRLQAKLQDLMEHPGDFESGA